MHSISLSTQNLTKRFDHFTAVDDVSFSVQRGEIYGLLGPNGAGKTTTIRLLLGLLAPTSGSGTVLGFDIVKQAERSGGFACASFWYWRGAGIRHRQASGRIRQHVGYVSQKFSLYPDLTARENFNFYGGVYGVPRDQLDVRRAKVLANVGLIGEDDTRTASLAGGSRQRLALACALAHEPEFLFLDEPTAGVDPISRRVLWDLVYDLAERGTTILVTTHYMDEAENCNRIAFIYRGKIVAEGTPQEMKSTQMQEQVVEIDCDPVDAALVALRESKLFDEVALYGSLIHAIGHAVEAKIGQVRATLTKKNIVGEKCRDYCAVARRCFHRAIEKCGCERQVTKDERRKTKDKSINLKSEIVNQKLFWRYSMPHRPPKQAMIIVPLIVLALVGYWIYSTYTASIEANTASGFIEGEEVTIAAEVGGRIEAIAVEEGDRVTAGQELVRLDRAMLNAQIAQAQAAVDTAKAQLAQVQAGARVEEVRQAEAALAQAVAARDGAKRAWENAQAARANPQELDARIAAADAQFKASKSQLDAARANATAARSRVDAIGGIDQTRVEGKVIVEAWAAAEAAVQTAQAGYDGAQKGLQILLDIRKNPVTLDAQIDAAKAAYDAATAGANVAQARFDALKAGATKEQIAVAEAAVKQAEAALKILDVQEK